MVKKPEKTGRYVRCEYCGKIVYKTLSQHNKREHHFCSNKCQALLKREQTFEYRICEICGKDFYVSKKSTQRFCSTECQRQWQKGNVGFQNKRFKGGYLKCGYCGKEFLVGKYKYEDNKNHFCSTQCRQNWFAQVWSQTDSCREESRKRAVKILNENAISTQTKPQIKVNCILDSLGVEYYNEHSFVYYSIDNYLPKYNLAIEVMGDYWHSSPIKYADKTNEKQKHIISRDKAKHTYLKKEYNIEILYLWETDIMKNEDVCVELIQRYINTNGKLDNYHSFNYSIKNKQLTLNEDLIIPYQQIAC